MRAMRVIPITILIVLALGTLAWLGLMPDRPGDAASATTRPISTTQPALRIGLIPERDLFQQRRMYRALADYIAMKLDRPVELVTASQYRGVLLDLAEDRIDAAFMGSLVTTLAVDRMGAQILASPELDLKVTTYRGVIFVPEDSPVKRLEDLAGKSIAMTRATTGGSLYAVYELGRAGLLNRADSPRMLWVGSHDDAIFEVVDGRADAGCAKDLRLDYFQKMHPGKKMRALVTGDSVPENAFVLRRDLAALAPRLREILLGMDKDPAGREALKIYGATRFRPCDLNEYKAVYAMVEQMGPAWEQVGVGGPPPKRPAEVRATTQPSEARSGGL